MSGKLAAHAADVAAAERAQMEDDASAARTWPISLHLTPFAPGCQTLAIDNPRRWRTFYGRPVMQVVKAVLARLNLTPTAVRAGPGAGPGDVDLLALPPAHLDGALSTPQGALVPYATFWDGLTLADLESAIAELTAQGWKPAAPLPANVA